LWLTRRFATETPQAPQELGLPGQTAAIGALGALAAGLIEAGRFGWANPWVFATFGAAIALLALFAGAVEPTG
jgi:hypothetical protein